MLLFYYTKNSSFMGVKQYLPGTFNATNNLEQLEIVAAELIITQHQNILFCFFYRPRTNLIIWLFPVTLIYRTFPGGRTSGQLMTMVNLSKKS